MDSIQLNRPVLSATLQPRTFSAYQTGTNARVIGYDVPVQYWGAILTGYRHPVIIETEDSIIYGIVPTQAPGETVKIDSVIDGTSQAITIETGSIANVLFAKQLKR